MISSSSSDSEINVIESLERINAANTAINAVELSESSSSAVLHSLKVTAAAIMTPPLGVISGISVPILSTLILRSNFNKGNIGLTSKLIALLLPWIIMSIPQTWFVWNYLGRRIINGNDALIPTQTDNLANDNFHVALELMANVSNFFNGFLVSHSVFGNKNIGLVILAGMIIGTINFIVNMLTEVPISFRQHAQYCDEQGKAIKPIFKQPLVEGFYNQAKKLGIFMREVYPPVNGIIRTVAGVQTLNTFINPTTPIARFLLGLSTAPLMYTSTSYVCTYFDVAHLRDNMRATGDVFSLENAFSQNESTAIRAVGRTLNGGILLDGLEKIGISVKMSLVFLLAVNVFSFFSLILNILHQYISTDNASRIVNCEEAQMTCFLAGEEEARNIGNLIEPVVVALAATLGFFSTAARVKKVYDNTSEVQYRNTNIVQVRPANNATF